jgi:hypothetical protein
MNNLRLKNHDNLKIKIDELIDFKGPKDNLHPSPKVKDQNLGQLNLPSKYATILTCSFEKGEKTGLDVKMLP